MTREKIEQHFGPEWVDFIAPFMQSDKWPPILQELTRMKKAGEPFAPDIPQVFRAFRDTPLSEVRVVLLGQDPYPVKGYATGLAFGHPKEVNLAPSLGKVIDAVEVDCYNGLQMDKPAFDTTLSPWAAQGVLLLNTALTVPEGQAKECAGKHEELWRPFTEYVIKKLTEVKNHLIWMSWGQKAQSFTKDISPFLQFLQYFEHPANAAREKRAWECRHFSTANAIIVANKLGKVIQW
jgi:uracil-DNA glycosylase